jgi:8-oxo-dGTP pyrophosphatase MutT (NUDIX family)
MPGAWAATGGSAIAGEDSITAVRRELREELGVDLPPERFTKMGRLLRRNSLCDLWLVRHDVAVPNLRLQREEVADARFVTPDQLRELVKKGKFHNYGTPYFNLLFEQVEARLKETC